MFVELQWAQKQSVNQLLSNMGNTSAVSLLFPSFSTRSSGGLWSCCGLLSNPSSSARTRDGEKYVVGSGIVEGGGSQGSFRMPWRGWARDRRNDDVNERPAALDGCRAR